MDDDYEVSSKFNTKFGSVPKRIVRVLSTDARSSISDIASRVGVSRTTVAKRIKKLERDLGMRYTLEINEHVIGLNSPHLILVKFEGEADYSRIKKLLERSHIPQVAATIHGTYDMFIYANAFSSSEYAKWDKGMQILLSEYGVSWQSSEVVHKQLGFFPLRNEMLDKAEAGGKYKGILKMLNSDSRMSINDMAKKLKIPFSTVAYNINKLMEEGIIIRPTVTMRIMEGLSYMSFFSKYVPSNGYEMRSAEARRAFMSDDRDPIISRYLITAPLIGSYDFFTLGVFDDFNTAYTHDILYHENLFKKHHIKMLYGEVEEVLLGKLPVRSMDTNAGYRKIEWSVEKD